MDGFIRRCEFGLQVAEAKPVEESPAMAALEKARAAWGMRHHQLSLTVCVVCNDVGCEHCPRV